MTTFVIPGGDLLEAARSNNLIDGFAHGANCWSTMGSGIAGIIKRDFFDLFAADHADERMPEQRLGGISYTPFNQYNTWGFNLYTQFYPGPNARIPSVISSVQTLFEQAHDIMAIDDDQEVYIGFPAIGCGIGGLNLVEVVSTINAVSKNVHEFTGRLVVPVFYIIEADTFKEEIRLLATNNPDIQIVDSEDDVKS